MVSEGAWVSTGEIISTLVQTDPVKVEFSVPEWYAACLKKGMSVQFTIAGLENPLNAEIYATEPQIDASTRAMKVRALTPNTSGLLIPGAFAELTINLGTIKDAIMVPTLTLVPLLNSQNVFLVKNERAQLTEVETGIRNEKMIQITQGIANGDTIATSGLLSLKEFMPVSVIKTEK
jgi:membrane fusion protein (multidrug efflux system)